ncbi:MAG: GldG family protein, partial [Anaerolineales bacterium]
MQPSLKRFAPLALALGLGGLLVAAVIWLIQRQANVYVQSGLAVGILGLALAVLFNPEAVQTWLGGRQARYGSNVALMSVAFIGIVVLVNYLVVRNPKRWDLSEDQVNTLAPETIEAIKQLPQPVQALGFYSINFASSQGTTRDLLERYKIESAGKFNYEFHDPINEPALARQYGITRDGTLVLTMGDQKEELTFASEQELTGALIRFSHPTKRVIYFLTGHGEKDFETAGDNSLTNIADLLQKQNYDILPLNLQVTTTIPSEARALVVAGPLVPVTQDEVNVISAYLQTQNASLIVLLDPPTGLENQTEPGTPEPLADYLRTAWGLHLSQDVIVDPSSSFPNQPFIPVSNEYGTSEITNKLQGVLTAFPLARSVLVSGTAETLPGIQWTPLVKTSAEAWGETDFDSMQGAG